MRFIHWAPALVLIASTGFAADPVDFLTATSRGSETVIEWLNPSSPVSFTRIIGRADTYASGPTDFGGAEIVQDVGGSSDEHHTTTHAGVATDATYFYTAFVNDGIGFSAATRVRVHTVDTSAGVFWALHIGEGTTSMAPPGLGLNILVGSNDGSIYAMERGAFGGVWPAGFVPLATGQPIQHRPPVFAIGGITTADHFALTSSQDGIVRAIDAEDGSLLWESADVGMVQAGPAGSLEAYGGAAVQDRVFFGSRNAGVDNAFHSINMDDGNAAWSFDNQAGGLGLGIVNGAASIDYARAQVYFASYERVAGASTVFALELDGGALVWRRPIGNVSASPVMRGDVLYVGAEDGLLYALDVADGTDRVPAVDTGDGALKGFVFPDYFGNRIYLSTTNAVHCFEDTGIALEKCWSYPVTSPSTPVYPPGSPFLWIGSGDGSLHQIEVNTGDALTAPTASVLPLGTQTAGIGAPSFDVFHGLVYVGSEDGVIYGVDAPF